MRRVGAETRRGLPLSKAQCCKFHAEAEVGHQHKAMKSSQREEEHREKARDTSSVALLVLVVVVKNARDAQLYQLLNGERGKAVTLGRCDEIGIDIENSHLLEIIDSRFGELCLCRLGKFR